MSKPLTPNEAEKLAAKIVSQYLNDCHISDRSQIGNYLMKLVSVAGVVMAQAEGSADAVARLQGTAEFVRKTMPTVPAQLRPVQ
jgi:hypothetical protein